MWHFDTAFSFSFYINENVDTVNGLQHKANSSTQVFLQDICNCDFVCKSSLEVEQMTAFYTYMWHASLLDTSLDFGCL